MLSSLVPPLVGGRFFGSIIAMVLVANRAAVNLQAELGKVTQLLWVDYFYSFQFVTCLISCIETATVHHLVRSGKESLALRVDQVFRVLMPFVVYPLSVAGLLIWAAFEAPVAGFVMVIGGILLPIVFGIFRVQYIQYKWNRAKEAMAVELVTASEAVISDAVSGARHTSSWLRGAAGHM